FVVIARHDNVVLHPNAWACRWPRRVILDNRVVPACMDDQIACLDLIDRARTILVQPIGLGKPSIVVFGGIAARVVVDLYFESRENPSPGGIGIYRSVVIHCTLR